MEDRYSSRNINISQNALIPRQNNYKVYIRKFSFRGGFIVLECPHCKNILELSAAGPICHLCGSRISWKTSLESCIKNLDDLIPFRAKRNKRRRRGRNDRKISSRKIEQQKQKKREFFRNELQKQKQSESQEELLLLNQDYFGRKIHQLSHEQCVPVRMIVWER